MKHPNLHIKTKLPNTGTTIFSIMSALANEEKAINLSQGFPGFKIDSKLTKLVAKYMDDGFNQYAPMTGVPKLCEAISNKVTKLYGTTYSAEKEINITSGATQAIYTAIAAMIRENDEVIIFDPAYDCYAPAVTLHGGIPVFINLLEPNFEINWDEVKKRVSQKTKMIIINSPQNPTGSVWTAHDIHQLEKITAGTDIIIISDEVYEHVIFDRLDHESVTKSEELASRSFVVYSFGKTYHATGWKMGYVLAPEELMKEFRKVHQYNVFTSNTPIQHAFADYMQNENKYLKLPDFYQKKRDVFRKSLEGSRFKVLNCSGSYFQLLDYSDITDEIDTEFAIRLTRESKVASIPISVFYNNAPKQTLLRFCFAKKESELKKAAEILCSI
ncbi:MAG: methionine aminotransferase [Bacteroidia bacterium]|nr:methionine aminotransferase [Bacteroidia bacterium]NNC86663.1 methionine aminotransferase [Bacteroidia bacterium]NNM15231.1 methionine aminotransferase [Bacteroidia bacterium]